MKRWPLLFLMLLAQMTAYATLVEMEPVKLTSRDEVTLENLACVGPQGVAASSFNALQMPHSPGIFVYVECLPHRTYQGHDVLTRVDCTRGDGAWKCQPGKLQIRIPNRHGTDTITLDQTTEKEALELVEFLDSLSPDERGGWPPEKKRILFAIDRDEESRFVVHEDLSQQQIVIRRTCTNNGCIHVVEQVWLIDY